MFDLEAVFDTAKTFAVYLAIAILFIALYKAMNKELRDKRK